MNTSATEKPVEFLWNTHTYVNEYIRFADTKAELVIGWTSAVMGALLAADFDKNFGLSVTGILSAVGLGLLLAAFVCAFMAVVPRLRTTQAPAFIYWKGILAHKSKENYSNAVEKLSQADLSKQLGGHLYDLSGICDAKFWWVNLSIVLGLLGSLLAGMMYLILH